MTLFFIAKFILHCFFCFYITWLTRIQLKHFKSVICRRKNPIQLRGTRNLNVIYLLNCTRIDFQPVYSYIFYGTMCTYFLLSFRALAHTVTHTHTSFVSRPMSHYTSIQVRGQHAYGCSTSAGQE